jgi:capsular polysaccharide biosynthesis protein
MELKQYWSVIRKNVWMIGLIVLIGAAATGYYSYFLVQKQYAASTKLIVNESQNVTIAGEALDVGSISASIQLTKTYTEIIRTPYIMKLVVEQYPELNATPEELIARVQVSSVNETQVMSISAIDNSYNRAANIVNAVSVVFQKEIPHLMKIDNVNILNQADPAAGGATISSSPVSNIMISIFMSLLLGIGFAFLREYLDDTVKTEKDVEQLLGFQTFAFVPYTKPAGRVSGDSRHNAQLRRDSNAALEV